MEENAPFRAASKRNNIWGNSNTSDKIVSFHVPHVRNLSVVTAACKDHLHRRAIIWRMFQVTWNEPNVILILCSNWNKGNKNAVNILYTIGQHRYCENETGFACSLRASSPIWTSETSLARTRERAAKPRGAEERIGSHAGVFRGARISSLRTTLLKSPAFSWGTLRLPKQESLLAGYAAWKGKILVLWAPLNLEVSIPKQQTMHTATDAVQYSGDKDDSVESRIVSIIVFGSIIPWKRP